MYVENSRLEGDGQTETGKNNSRAIHIFFFFTSLYLCFSFFIWFFFPQRDVVGVSRKLFIFYIRVFFLSSHLVQCIRTHNVRVREQRTSGEGERVLQQSEKHRFLKCE